MINQKGESNITGINGYQIAGIVIGSILFSYGFWGIVSAIAILVVGFSILWLWERYLPPRPPKGL